MKSSLESIVRWPCHYFLLNPPTTSWLGLIIIQHLLQLIPAIIIAKFANLRTFNYGGMLSVGKLVGSWKSSSVWVPCEVVLINAFFVCQAQFINVINKCQMLKAWKQIFCFYRYLSFVLIITVNVLQRWHKILIVSLYAKPFFPLLQGELLKSHQLNQSNVLRIK